MQNAKHAVWDMTLMVSMLMSSRMGCLPNIRFYNVYNNMTPASRPISAVNVYKSIPGAFLCRYLSLTHSSTICSCVDKSGMAVSHVSHSKYEIWNIVGCVNQFAIALVLQCIVIHCQYTSSVSKHNHIALQKSSTRTTGTFRWTVRRCRCKKRGRCLNIVIIFFFWFTCVCLWMLTICCHII